VAPTDWQIYNEMRSLAHEKYGVEMQEVHLPGQTLGQVRIRLYKRLMALLKLIRPY
jgi:hypothetical protein